MKFLHLILCPWICSSVSWFTVYGNLNRICILLLCKMEKAMAPHSMGWRSLVGCSPWGHWESDTTEQLHFHLSLSCIGEGNGNPLQYYCLRIPWMEEPGGLQSTGSQRVGHNWASDLTIVSLILISHLNAFFSTNTLCDIFNLLTSLRLSMAKSKISLGKCHTALESMWVILKYLLVLIFNIIPQW